MSWQPIETAPKDGSPVDLWIPGWGRVVNMRWIQFTGKEGFFSPIHEGPTTVREATHWMPIPQPPEQA